MALPAPFHRPAGRRRPAPDPSPRPVLFPAPAAADPRRSGSSVPGAAELVERAVRAARQSDDLHFTDRTDGTPVPRAVQRVAIEVLRWWLAPVREGRMQGHVATIRMRIADGQLLLSAQTAPRSGDVAPFVPNLEQRARHGAAIEEVGGRMLTRATADRNRLVVVHLPLDDAAG